MAITMDAVSWDLCLGRIAPPTQDRRLHLRDGETEVAAWFGARPYQEQDLPVAAIVANAAAGESLIITAEAQIAGYSTFTDQFGASWNVLITDARGLKTMQLDGTCRVDLVYSIIVQDEIEEEIEEEPEE
jgi:hypothetical protein